MSVRHVGTQTPLRAISPPVVSAKFPLRAVDSDRLFDVFVRRGPYWTIFDRISSFLPIGDIHVLRRTCRAVQPIYDELVKSQWSVDARLKRFFKDPLKFREVVGRCDALISGDFALEYFERVSWKDSSCDIYVNVNRSKELKQHIIAEGYKLESTTQVGLEDWDSAVEAPQYESLNFIRSTDSPEDYQKVEVKETVYTPLAAILESVYATSLVNVISWNKAYAVFPQPTFLQYKAYMLKLATDEYGPLLGDLSSKGWRTQPIVWRADEDDVYDAWLGRTDCYGKYSTCRRRIGDPLTWQISFPTIDMEKSKTPDSALEYSEFSIARPAVMDDSPKYAVSCYILKARRFRSLVLRYEYTSCEDIMRSFYSRLETLTRMELLKLKPSERPAALMRRNIFGGGNLCAETFDPPENWAFYDDDLCKWIDQAERISCRRIKNLRKSRFKRDQGTVAPERWPLIY
ncbi:hypothetical protein BLS_002678 [Venturia inaequalis]|uniref:Uncharacterized protein n=1 Tax=Venturia inaequalis TaxID=5025 RepID=A0A8H3YSK5_VENIN|nr:hypothetical protein EG327_010280 [Venturia inaequalis]KAE9975308.1 hypothetical protein BLS_002678 [Venturia inaequalis]KAE9977290.1 hypothetical protein EG328_002119 [Venturia inaequalis]